MTHPMTPREKVARAALWAEMNHSPGVWDTQPEEWTVEALELHGYFAIADAVLAALASGSGDHAELKRLAEMATLGKWQNGIDDCEGVVAIAEHAGNVICLPPSDDMQASLEFWPRNAAFIAAANPARVLALLAEIAALRGENDALEVERLGLRAAIFGSHDYDPSLRHGNFIEMARHTEDARKGALTRATQAERQRDEAVGALQKLSAAISWTDYPFIDNNTGRDEIVSRLGFMQKDAEQPRAFLASMEPEK